MAIAKPKWSHRKPEICRLYEQFGGFVDIYMLAARCYQIKLCSIIPEQFPEKKNLISLVSSPKVTKMHLNHNIFKHMLVL